MAGSRAARQELCGGLISEVAADKNLMAALQHISSYGGKAAGKDELRPTDMSTSEQWEYVRRIRRYVMSGEFSQGELKRKGVPKRLGHDRKRTIYVQTLADRVISRAIVQVIGPVLELFADDFSYARSGRGYKHAVASACYLVEQEARKQWIVEDLAKAFDRVPRRKLYEILYWALPNQEICDLTLELAKAPSRHGILQGASVSPLLLNLYLDRTLHRQWRKRHPNVPLLRYVDDIVVSGGGDDDLDDCYRTLSNLATAAGFKLKQGPAAAMRDLSMSEAEWLGYLIAEGPTRPSLRPACYCSSNPADIAAHSERLRGKFRQLHEQPNPWTLIQPLVSGHVEHLSPSYLNVDRQAICGQIISAARDAGLGIPGGEEGIRRSWETAYGRYLGMASTVERQMAICREAELSSLD